MEDGSWFGFLLVFGVITGLIGLWIAKLKERSIVEIVFLWLLLIAAGCMVGCSDLSSDFKSAAQNAYDAVDRFNSYKLESGFAYESRLLDAEKAVSAMKSLARSDREETISQRIDDYLSWIKQVRYDYDMTNLGSYLVSTISQDGDELSNAATLASEAVCRRSSENVLF